MSKKYLLSILSFILALSFFLVSCSNTNIKHSEPTSPTIDNHKNNVEDTSTNNTPGDSFDNSIYFEDELPDFLTDEELAKKDEIVPFEFWGHWASLENSYNSNSITKNKFHWTYLRYCFNKPLIEITYGELWRFNNNNQYLNISGDIYGTVSDIIKEFKSIKYVTIEIPPAFLTQMYAEEYSYNNIFYDMNWLKGLKLEGNNIFAISDEELKLIPFDKLPDLEELYITHQQILTNLPDNFYNNKNLKHISLLYNYLIEELPPSIYLLENLETLNLEGTAVIKLDDNAKNWQKLETIYLPYLTSELTSIKHHADGKQYYKGYTTHYDPLPNVLNNLTNLTYIKIPDLYTAWEKDKYLEFNSILDTSIVIDSGYYTKAEFIDTINEVIEQEKQKSPIENVV